MNVRQSASDASTDPTQDTCDPVQIASFNGHFPDHEWFTIGFVTHWQSYIVAAYQPNLIHAIRQAAIEGDPVKELEPPYTGVEATFDKDGWN